MSRFVHHSRKSTEEEMEVQDQQKTIEKVNFFFIVWESNCRNFISESIQFSCEKAVESVAVHVFMRRDTPTDALPPGKEWIQQHMTLTTCPYASETAICAWLVQHVAPVAFDKRDVVVYVVSDRERQFEELIAILTVQHPNLSIREIIGSDKTILDVLQHVCKWCEMVFVDKNEKEMHFNLLHDFYCTNSSCNKQCPSQEELNKHLKNQKNCHFCPENPTFCNNRIFLLHLECCHGYTGQNDEMTSLSCKFCCHKKFTSIEQKEIHMKNCHKKCNCGCGEYFSNRDEYIEHFYAVYPLACYENRKCPQRFQSVLDQALHHKQDHLSLQPFYCVVCRQNETNGKVCFKDENSLRSHGNMMSHARDAMYLPDQRSIPRRVASRTCSAINYC